MNVTRRAALACLAASAALAGSTLAAPVSAAPARAAAATDLVLLYRFDTHTGATVPDASATRADGRLVNADPATAYVASRPGYGSALSLVGEGQEYVAVPEKAALDVDRWTLAALVRRTGVENPATAGRWEVLEKTGAYWINVRTDGKVRAGGFFGGCTSSRYWKYVDSNVTVPVGAWTHVAATYNGSRLTVYVNGTAAGSLAVTGRTCANNLPLSIGAKNAPATGVEAFWDGQLDAVRINRRALSAAEVDALAP